jgi:predicted ATPase
LQKYIYFLAMITFILDSLMNCGEKAEKNLFREMEHSDMVIENLKEKAIIFVGEQNVGKSTLVDLVTNSPMIGKGQGENACYVSMSAKEEEIVTEDSNRYRPPVNNIKQYSRDVSCIDLGSWKEDGDYIDSIGFTYFLHKVLQKVREVKFVLVIE